MKIMKIFGLVVGVHVVAFMCVFAIPGCRSTTRHSPPPPESVQAEAAPVHAAPLTPVSDLATPVVPGSGPVDASNPVAAGSPVSAAAPTVSFDANPTVVRYNPTRPGSPVASAIATPATQVTPATTHVVTSGETLWKIAKQHGLTMKELAAANHLKPDANLREGQKIIIPGKAAPSSVASSVPTSATGDTLVYRVKAGETLAVIARHAGTTSAAIKSLNHLKSDTVRTGQELTLPAGNAAAAALAASSTTENSPTPAPTNSNAAVHHTVKAGETLGQIARHYGVSRRDLAVANNIADPLKLRAGQDLIIPNPKTGTASSTSSTASTNSAATPADANAPANSSPIASPVAPAPESTPVAAPPASDTPTPPVIQVQDSNPVAAPK